MRHRTAASPVSGCRIAALASSAIPRRSAILSLATVLVAAACSAPPESSVSLAEALSRAQNRPETRRIDLGTAGAWEHVIAGFEERRQPVEVLRSHGRAVAVDVEVSLPRITTVVVRARAPGHESPLLRVSIQGVEVGEIRLADRYREVELTVPGRLWTTGSNRLAFEIPPDAPLPERIDWDWIEFRREVDFDAEPAALRRDAARLETLEVTYGTRLIYPLRLPPEPRLRIEALSARGTGGRLELRLLADAADGGARELLAQRIEVGAEAVTVDRELPRPTDGIVLLELRPVPDGDDRVVSGALLLGDARIAGATRPTSTEPMPVTPGAKPPVIVFLVDTLRADRLGAYGYDRPTSPRLDRFAAERAVLFESALAHSSWTKPTVASIFTATHPSTHGVVDRETMLVDEAETMAEILGAAGYETAGFVTITTVASIFGFDQGFDLYAEMLEESTPRVHQPAGRVVDAALEWIDGRKDPARPFLLYVHVADPHTPYVPPEAQRRRLAPDVEPLDPASFATDLRDWQPGTADELERFRSAASDLYDAEVAYVDEQFGRFLDGLEERGLLDSSAVVFLSDHGEEFYEHGGWTHGHTLYQEQLHVPLLLQLPGGRHGGRRVRHAVRQVDLLPTLMELAGLAAPPGLQGVSLLSAPTAASGRRVRSHLRLGDRVQDAMIEGRWKLVLDDAAESGPGRELFDLVSDPTERHDLWPRRPVTAAYVTSWLEETGREFAGAAIAAADMELPADVEARLRALGYIR